METIRELIERLRQTDETTQIEAKRGAAVGTSLLETICGFANEPGLGGGCLLLGVVKEELSLFPDYEVVGVTNPDKVQADLATQCAAMFNLPIRPVVEVENIGGKAVVRVTVAELASAQKPLFFKAQGLPQGAWRRIGSTDQRCTEDDLLLFYGHHDSFDSAVVEGATLADVDEDAVRRYRTLRAKVDPEAEELASTDEDLLLALNCARRLPTGVAGVAGLTALTYAGLLVFGSRLAQRRLVPAMRVDYIRVPGTEWVSDPDDRFTTVDMRGPLLTLLGRAYNAVADDLPRGFLLPEGELQAQPVGLPARVLREALVNALMHRSYRVHEPTQIIRYANRIEIRNPGFSLKPEEQLGEPGSPQRNPFIASVFHETKLAETKGSGIRAMRKLLKQAGLAPPTFESDHANNRFQTRLLLHHFLDEADVRWLTTYFGPLGLTADQQQALVFVREVKAINNATYRQLSGQELHRATAELRALRELGLLEAKGKYRYAYYVPGPALRAAIPAQAADPTEAETETRVPQPPELMSQAPGQMTPPPEAHSTTSGQMAPPPELMSQPPGLMSQPPGLMPQPPGLMSQPLPETLTAMVALLKRRSSNAGQLDEAVEALCQWQPLTPKQLAAYVGRTENYLRRYVIPRLRRAGRLRYTIPDMPNHPQQAYTAAD